MSRHTATAVTSGPVDVLHAFIERHPRLLVLTGAGCSTASGIPDYRDARGNWKHRQPVMYQDFVRSPHVRQRYWARSLVGWPLFAAAQPNAAHRALAGLEAAGRVQLLVTQNVDGLHQRAGSRQVLDLHGRIDAVECLGCRARTSRAQFQDALRALNPKFTTLAADIAPDGDAQLDGADFSDFRVPECRHCGGLLKPAVVFFGESVPDHRVTTGHDALTRADALLIVGSSLMVYSGYRFVRAAVAAGKPVAAINRGRTRADADFALKIEESCDAALASLLDALTHV
jgi:NAD-dependent SIR2 family protein deacetylase